jgi:hypothetical protein
VYDPLLNVVCFGIVIGTYNLTGPFTNNEYLLVVIDYYSRFPVVEIVRSITSATIINKLRKIFAVHGICNELVSDNALLS